MSSKKRKLVVSGPNVDTNVRVNDQDVWGDLFDGIEATSSSQLDYSSSPVLENEQNESGDRDAFADAAISTITSVFSRVSNSRNQAAVSAEIGPQSAQSLCETKISRKVVCKTALLNNSPSLRNYKEYRTHTTDQSLVPATPNFATNTAPMLSVADLRALAHSHQELESVEYVLDGLRVKHSADLLALNSILLSTLFDLAFSTETNTSMRIFERLLRLVSRNTLNENNGQFLLWLVCINICLFLKALKLGSDKLEARQLMIPCSGQIIDSLTNYDDSPLPISLRENKKEIDNKLEAPHITFIQLLTEYDAFESWEMVERVRAVFFACNTPHKLVCVTALSSYVNKGHPIKDLGVLNEVFDTIQFDLDRISDMDMHLIKLALLCTKSHVLAELSIFQPDQTSKVITLLCDSLKAAELLSTQTNFALFLVGIIIDLCESKIFTFDTSLLVSALLRANIADIHLKGYTALLLATSMGLASSKERVSILAILKQFALVAGSKGLEHQIKRACQRLELIK